MSSPFRIVRLVLLIGVFALIFYARMASVAPGLVAGSGAPADTTAGSVVQGVPQKAVDVLKHVRTTGEAPEGYVGGRVFENREELLPADGDYREFDVDPHDGQRNAERLIVEWKSKKAWYTGDHYRTFTEVP